MGLLFEKKKTTTLLQGKADKVITVWHL